MFKFKSLDVENYILYEKAHLSLDYKGITVINGINHDAHQQGMPEDGNAAGKSIIPKVIPDFFLQVNPAAHVGSTKTKKDAFFMKGASSTLTWVGNDGKEYSGRKYMKGQSFRYDIKEKGKKPKNFNTATPAERWLDEQFPLDQDKFFSTVYLENRKANLNLFGTGANRFNFFSDMFILDEYDDIRTHFLSVRAQMKDDAIRLDTLRTQLNDLDEEVSTLRKSIGKITRKKLKKWSSELEVLRDLRYRVQQVRAALKESDQSETKYDEKEESRLLDAKSELQTIIDRHEEWVDWNKRNKKKQVKLDKLNKTLKKLTAKYGDKLPKKLSKTIGTMQAQLSADVKAHREQEAINDKHDGLKKQLAKLTPPKKKAKHYAEMVTELRVKIRAEKATVEKYAEVSDGECPTCGSTFDKKHIKLELKRARKAIATYSKERDKAEKLESNAERYETVTTKLKGCKYKKINSKGLDKLLAQVKLLRQIEDVQDDIARLDLKPCPKAAKKCKDIEKTEGKLVKIKEQLRIQARAKQATPMATILSQFGFDTRKQVDKAADKLKGKDLEATNTKIVKFTSQMDALDSALQRHEKLTAEVKTIDDAVKFVKAVDAIILAYGPTGLKRLACAEVASDIQDEINKHIPLIYQEPCKFHFEITPNDFHILREDKRGCFDVRTLSGSEACKFQVLAMLALLPAMPSYLRTNLLVLDEMDANYSEVGKKMFANELIPALTSVVDHVMIVSPSDSIYPNSRVFVAEKRNAQSQLIQIS